MMGGTSTGYELVTYYGPNGETVNIPFFNGMPLGAIPVGYTKTAPQEKAEDTARRDDDNSFDAASAERGRQRIADAEKKEINFSNPDEVMSAVDTYYSSQDILGKAGTAMFGIPGLIGSKLIGRYERGNLLAGIDKALADDSIDDETKKALGIRRGYLEDKDSYVDYQEKQGKTGGFLDGLKKLFSGEREEKVYNRPENISTDEKWKSTALGNWVDATNYANSVSPDDPAAWNAAMQAQAEASREASAAARAASGWDNEDYTPSGAPEPTVFNSSNDKPSYSNTDSWEDDEGFGVG